jgi:acyl-ACP thioesterase
MNHQKGTLDLSSIINYFQDCSTFQSEDMNRGLTYLHAKNRVWLLSSWQLEVKQAAHLGDGITVETWAYDFRGFYGYRNFIMMNDNDEVLSVANSIWVYLDTTTGRPARIPEQTGYNIEPMYPMEYAERKIEIPPDLTPYPSFPVVKSNIDSYNHVNNGQYIKMAEEFLPQDLSVTGMRVEYRKQAILGDIIIPMVSLQEGTCVIVLSDTDQKPYAIIEFKS